MIFETTAIQGFAVLLFTATVLGFLAKKTKQPTIVAYIIAGLVLGPVGLSAVSGTELTDLFAELGLAFLLFLIGLEMRLDKIKEIIKPVTAIAMGQMAIVAGIMFLTMQALGFAFLPSLFIAAATMYSSTAVVVKILSDKDEISTLPGRLNVGMLLIEDIVVVILIAIVSTGSTTITNAIYSLGEVLGVVLGLGILSFAFSKYALPKIFKEVSSNPHSFFIHGLAWAFLLIAVSSRLGISIEIGAFIAGLSLGQIPYSEELQERIRPLSDFFMAIFFINVGLTLGAKSLTAMWKEALVASMVVMVAKFFTIFFLTDWFKFSPETSFKTSINKTQISEFALIFGMMGVSHGVISRDIVAFLSIVAIITMGASSYLLRYNNEIYIEIQHLLQRFESEEKGKEIMEDLKDHAVILGYNDTVKTVLPAVKGEYKEVVLVDRNSKNTQELRDKEVEYIYGDFKHGNIRQSCNLKNAAFILSVVPDIEAQHHLLEEAPEEAIKFLEAESFENAAGFYERGADFVMIENLITAEKMKDYLQMYLEDPGVFQEEVEEDLEAIYWGGRSV